VDQRRASDTTSVSVMSRWLMTTAGRVESNVAASGLAVSLMAMSLSLAGGDGRCRCDEGREIERV
jgi:hypothetical protein